MAESNMEQEEVLRAAKLFAHSVHTNDRSGHDWPHIERVAKWSSRLAVAEGADPFVCELAALIHDVGDEKLNDSKQAGELKVRSWLDSQPIADAVRQHVWDIISTMSFNGGVNAPMRTIEGEVVQDADRLDAIGAIGIARTFVYAGSRGHSMYDPEVPSRMSMSASEYRNGKQTAINHFYEKLLLLKDRMNTESGRRTAEERHAFMESYLKQFLDEWNGCCGGASDSL